MLTSAIVLGHAIKHVYISGFQTIVFPEMKIALGLSNTSFGALATARQATSGATTLGAGYLGDRFSNQAGLLLAISLSLMGISYFLVGSAPSYPLPLPCHAAGRLGSFSVSPSSSGHLDPTVP